MGNHLLKGGGSLILKGTYLIAFRGQVFSTISTRNPMFVMQMLNCETPLPQRIYGFDPVFKFRRAQT